MINFGTDGIRGKFGSELTEELCYLTGLAVGYVFGGSGVIGIDTRLSSQAVQSAVTRGILDSGSNAINAGVVTSPCLAYLTRSCGASFGIMVTASHNPPEYNGIKVFDKNGNKLSTSLQDTIEYYMSNSIKGSVRGKNGRISTERYISYLEGLVPRLDGLKVLLDHGNGCGSVLFGEVMRRLGAVVTFAQKSVNGGEINCECGATCPEFLVKQMELGGNDIGFSLDGDGDRVVCYTGKLLDGDEVLYNLSSIMGLADSSVVGTVLTNTALEVALASQGNRLVRTSVGDRNIADVMRQFNYKLGGEPSGHYIMHPYQTTGDGCLASLMLCRKYLIGIQPLDLFPQKSVSIDADRGIIDRADVVSAVRRICGRVRIVMRNSGTEPKLRIMVEGESDSDVDIALNELIEIVRK